MKFAPLPANEKERIDVVQKMGILDTDREDRFDAITQEAKEKLKVPMSTITIMDTDREWFKSYQGLEEREGPRKTSFCGHALVVDDIFIVEDTLKDERFMDNPMVIGEPFVRFYAGVALRDRKYKTGLPVGVFCVKDTKPRKFELDEINILLDLASKAEIELNK